MANSNTLIGKLDELDRRLAEVAEQMNDPEIACNPTKIIELAKES